MKEKSVCGRIVLEKGYTNLHHYHKKWLDWGRDAVIFASGLVSLGVLLVGVLHFFNLPGTVDAQGEEIKTIETKITMLHETDSETQKELSLINQSLKQNTLDHAEIKEWLKSIAGRKNEI